MTTSKFTSIAAVVYAMLQEISDKNARIQINTFTNSSRGNTKRDGSSW